MEARKGRVFKGNRNEQLIEVTTDQRQQPYFDPSRVTFHYSRCGREPNQRLCATDCEAAPLWKRESDLSQICASNEISNQHFCQGKLYEALTAKLTFTVLDSFN